MYLRFVWGRSRLPLTSKEFKRKHRIDLLRINTGDVNKALPLAHTWYVVFVGMVVGVVCTADVAALPSFFSIELPAYTTLEAMEDRLRYAFTNCTAIDTDGGPREIWSDDEDEEFE